MARLKKSEVELIRGMAGMMHIAELVIRSDEVIPLIKLASDLQRLEKLKKEVKPDNENES